MNNPLVKEDIVWMVDEVLRRLNETLRPIFESLLSTLLLDANANNLISQAAAARIRGCSRRAISYAIKKGKLRSYTPSGLVKIEEVFQLKMRAKNWNK